MLLILFFILVLNVVSIALTYFCLSSLEKKERIIFIVIGIAVNYILTSFVYWLSTKNISIKEVSETGKNVITFLFVPINSIIILPILAKSYDKYKNGKLSINNFKNRGIILAIILAIALIVEYSYFKDIQNGVIKLIEQNTNKRVETKLPINENISSTNVEIVNETNINEQINEIYNQTNSVQTNEVNGVIVNET